MARHIEIPQRATIGETVCAAEAVHLERGGRALLDSVSLELRAGEVLALLGPNGAGKSTLLSVLSGDVAPDRGSVRFGDREIGDWSLSELSRRRGVLLQDNQLLFPFTVHQVVEMGRAPWRRTPLEDDDNAAISEAIAAADIAHLGNRRVPSLSGGERARAGFARVMAGRTGVLMLDEPTAALDLGHQEAVLGIARERARAGDAVLVVLHDLNLAGAYADRIALLRDGRIIACDAPERVLTAEVVSDVYQTPVEVIPHPVTGRGIVLPRRF
ncbi:heme ABC transporter ATP-binding protein [Leucobacter muris]|jgi:iron complex transport system ATP-binding protein|uniref:Heme ABC transporter ATP-binding protein n=1 Tax=Leucobacter muris TaxID=1935379 RepID=A0ABX5QH92_9MICO|nr:MULTISPECIES: heme ABC transporter ATP-binding protein [Leucobacter]QAB18454.1 heme ABC transporter ATP-binding protein [Leucobacter muris]